jgi:hypothetical protein
MTPNVITHLFKEAHDSFPPLKGKPTNNDQLAIQETLLPLLMVIPYNQLNGVHSLMAIFTKAVKYKTNQGARFLCPARLPLHDKLIANNTTTVVCGRTEAAHKSNLTTTPILRRPNEICPNFSVTSLMKFGTMT